MVEVVNPDKSPKIIYLSPKTIGSVAVAGLILGIFAYVLTLVLDRAILAPLLCGGADSFMACANTTRIAANIATVLAAVAGMFMLLRLGVFRPLLIALAAAIILWGSTAWLQVAWWEAALWSAALYAVVYTALVWLSRIRHFAVALGAVVLLVAAAKLLALI